jgi:ATP-dependent exoDNAse (exonuclease V) beta subunit
MPTVFHGAFPRYPLTLVDEAQDLSALNHATLRKMIGTRRLIAVGDPNQAIYGFRGAHENSMEKLRTEFDMKEMRLSISFRCPIAIVKHSHWRSPTMRWPEWAKPGAINYLNRWSANDIPDSATIICRNNAPLFALAIKLQLAGRPVELHGRDVINSITKIMRKFGGSDMRNVDVLDRINVWLEEQKEKNKERAHKGLEDRAECMRIFASQGLTLGDALAYAQHLIQMHSPIKMMTGHAAKGLEFDNVFFLDNELIEKDEQERNLRHVIITRVKETLTYINSDDYVQVTKDLENVEL